MKLIYVSGPFTADNDAKRDRNIETARLAGLRVRAAGLFPVVPHLAIIADDPKVFTYEDAMQECLAILARCDAILLIGNWRGSIGAQRERKAALELGMPIFYEVELLEAWGKRLRPSGGV